MAWSILDFIHDPKYEFHNMVLKTKYNFRSWEKVFKLLDYKGRSFLLNADSWREKGTDRLLPKQSMNFSLQHLQDIHYQMFKDVVPWAGHLREDMIGRNGVVFCIPEYLEEQTKSILKSARDQNFFMGASNKDAIHGLAQITHLLINASPFREGNDLAVMSLVHEMGLVAGIDLNFDRVDTKDMKIASTNAWIEAGAGPIEELYKQIAEPIGQTRQRNFIAGLESLTSKKLLTVMDNLKEQGKLPKRSVAKNPENRGLIGNKIKAAEKAAEKIQAEKKPGVTYDNKTHKLGPHPTL